MTEDSGGLVLERLRDSLAVKSQMLTSDCVGQATAVAEVMITSLRAGGKILFFGNGGSAMDAGHLAAELAGRFYRDRPGLAGISLSDGTASLTAIANDYAYDDVFARQIRGLGRPGDVAGFFSSRRRHTRSLSDWSSDVCSSDLIAATLPPELPVSATI